MVAGIRHPRRARISDERHALPSPHPRHQLGRAAALDGVVVADQARADAVVAEQDRRPPRVLGGDHVDLREHPQGPQRHVLEVPDRRRHHVEDAGRAHPRNTRPASATVRSSQPNCTTRNAVASDSALTTPRWTTGKETRGWSALGWSKIITFTTRAE